MNVQWQHIVRISSCLGHPRSRPGNTHLLTNTAEIFAYSAMNGRTTVVCIGIALGAAATTQDKYTAPVLQTRAAFAIIAIPPSPLYTASQRAPLAN